MQYRGYDISRRTKTIDHHNPISGHQWTTLEDIGGFEVQGQWLPSRNFNSLYACYKHIDFLVKFDPRKGENK